MPAKKLILVSGLLFLSFAASPQALEDILLEVAELFNKNDCVKAIPAAEKAAMAVREAMGEENLFYTTMLTIQATCYHRTFQYERSEAVFIRVLSILKINPGEQHTNYAAALNNLAAVYNDMGQYEKAEPLYFQAKNITKEVEGENSPAYAISLNNMAGLYHGMGLYTKAEPLYFQAIEIRKKTLGEEHPSYATALNNLATLYLEMGQFEKAEPLFIQAMEIRKKTLGEDHPDYATSLNNLAAVWEDMTQYEKAERLYIQAKDLRKKELGENHRDYAASLNNLGGLYVNRGEYEKSLPLIIQAVAIWKNALGENHPDYATSLNNLAALYRKSQKQYEKAETLYLEALAIRKKTLGAANPYYADSQNDLALLYSHMGQYEKAEPHFLSSSRIVLQNLLYNFTILSDKEKRNYLNDNFFMIESNNSFLYNYQKASSATIINNFNILLGFKSLSLADTRNMLGAIRNSKDSSIKKLFYSWQAHKFLLAKQYALPVSSRMDRIKKIEEETESFEKELNRRSVEFRSQQTNLKVSVADVQKNLEEGEVAVEFVRFRLYNKKWTDSVLYGAYILGKNDPVPHFIPLFEEKQLQKLFDRAGKGSTRMATGFYRGPEEKNTDAGILGKELFQLVWQPLEPYLEKVAKISYSPSGLLYNIAFHALPYDDGKLLLDKYQLQQYISTRQIALRTDEPSPKPGSIVLFGDPNFSMDSIDLVKERNKISDYAYVPLIRGENAMQWPGLPGTGEEVKNINQLFSQNAVSTKVFLNTNASEANLKALSGKSPAVLHIATHGFFLPIPEGKGKKQSGAQSIGYRLADDPLLRSGLILAGGNYAWSGKIPVEGVEDGVVTAYEIAQLNLSTTELVTLSACKSALGDIKGSEGVFGLQRSFKMAGVKKIIVSLWEVPDKETVELMTTFYTYWLQGKTISDSFYSAQADIRKKYSPVHWAAFVLVE